MSLRDILIGAAGILDFAGYLRHDRYFESDRMAIASDWRAVGDDLRAAMNAELPETPVMTAQEICHTMNGETFERYIDMHDRILGVFNQYLEQFPRHYSCYQFIDWMLSNRWIEKVEEGWRIRC